MTGPGSQSAAEVSASTRIAVASASRLRISGAPAVQNRQATAIAISVAVLFFASAVFRIRDYDDKSLDLQGVIRLAVIAGSFTLPLWPVNFGRQVIRLRTVPMLWLGLFAWLTMTAVYAPSPSLTLVNGGAFLAAYAFGMYAVAVADEGGTVIALIIATALLCAVSIVVYYAVPQLGRMHAWTGEEHGINGRMSGIIGTPNGLGLVAAVGLLLILMYFKSMSSMVRRWAIVMTPVLLVCLVMTDNRAAALGLVLCAALYVITGRNSGFATLLIALAGLLAVTVLVTDAHDLMSSLARSGDAEEITSATGRTAIWAVVLEKIGQRPLLGYGYASAQYILPLDPRLFTVAAHAHNAYLQIAFSGGAIAAVLYGAALIATLWKGLRYRCREPLIVFVFFVVRGLTESSPFVGPPAFAGHVFVLATLLIDLRAERMASVMSAQSRQRAQHYLSYCRSALDRTLRPTER